MAAEFKSRRREFIAAMRKAAMQSVVGASVILQREIVLQLSKRGSTKAAGNIPSPPGEPPSVQTGALRRSIVLNRTGLANTNPQVEIGTALKYARIQEFGGVIHLPRIVPKRGRALHWKNKQGQDVFARSVRAHTVRLPPRPYFRPGIALALPKIERFIAGRFDKVAVSFK